MNDEPFGLLITWTCYGTWLPGDPRGYVSNTLQPGGRYEKKENVPGTPFTADDPRTARRARSLQKSPTVTLSPEQALLTAKALCDAARKRGWWISRGAVMCNHVHVVVIRCPDDGPKVRRILKGCSQAELSKSQGASKRWWTRGGSDRRLRREDSFQRAVRYVQNQEGILAEIVDMEVVVPGSPRERPRG